MLKKARILICDDESGIRDALTLILEEAYELSYTTNGEEALTYLKTNSPDLMILDVKMPRMGGLDVLRHIKHLRPKMPVLMATGYESCDVASQASSLGADDYLVKPFDRHQVREKVEALLSLFR